MAFGFGKKRDDDDDEEDDDEEEEDVDLVNFQGALNGKTADMAANARLVQAALRPTKDLITDGLERRAEMIRVDIKGEKAQSVVSVDGMPFAGGRMAKPQATAITQMLKVLCGLDARLKGKLSLVLQNNRNGLHSSIRTWECDSRAAIEVSDCCSCRENGIVSIFLFIGTAVRPSHCFSGNLQCLAFCKRRADSSSHGQFKRLWFGTGRRRGRYFLLTTRKVCKITLRQYNGRQYHR